MITLLGPLSGAHLNPVVSTMFWRTGALNMSALISYIIAQLAGGLMGVWLTHLLFDLPMMQISSNPRTGTGIWVSELVATLIIVGCHMAGGQACA